MQIFNTLTRQKEEFEPQVPGEYRIYVCGPTVYNYIHIGNARPLIVFDTLRRYLEYRGNKVIYVSNITDIDDKLIKKGQEEGTSMKEVAQRFEAEYLKDAEGLNCKKPTVQPRATEHIQQILDIVKDLIDSGHAYVAKNGDVYFRREERSLLRQTEPSEAGRSGERQPGAAQPDGRRSERGPRRLCRVEGCQARRTCLGEPLWHGPPRLAHRVQRHEPHPSG